jgi:GTPase Era involved in 16S rRNA processing
MSILCWKELFQLNTDNQQFINTITGFEIDVGHNLEPCTSQVHNFRSFLPEVAYGDLVFVDTPGFDSAAHKSDSDILKMVADWLKATYVFVAVNNFNMA